MDTMGIQLKVILTILFMAHAIANKDYSLKCELQELGIFWPNYNDNMAYYFCPRLGEKQITLRCDSGKLFCFVLQLCVNPNEYIPPPSLEQLPTAKSILTTTTTTMKYPTSTFHQSFPTPKYPTGSSRIPPPVNSPSTTKSPGLPTLPTPPTPPIFTKQPPRPPSPPNSAIDIPLPPTPKPTPPNLELKPPGPRVL